MSTSDEKLKTGQSVKNGPKDNNAELAQESDAEIANIVQKKNEMCR